jgi:hypothetical protein
MRTIVVETPIARPADHVFAYLRNHTNQLEWQAAHVMSVEVEPPGPSETGTRVHKVRRTPMGELSFTEQVIALDEAERRWTERTISGGIQGTEITWQVLPSGGDSTIRLEAAFRAKGVQKLLLPLIRRSAAKDWDTEFATLKELLEG